MMKTKNTNTKLLKISAVLAASLLAIGLAACSAGTGGDERPEGTSDAAALVETQPSGADEAAKLYEQLMQKENEVLSADSQLWEKLFLSASKESPMIEDGSNYGDFLLATLEGAKDKFTAQELETLKTGAEQIKQIEDKLAALEQEFPGCGSTPGQGESVDAQSAGMTAKAEGTEKFPSFNGKDLDGNDVSSDELFSNNTVTVVNFWFTTCKPCVGELGELEALNQKLADKGGAVVGVNSFTLDGDKAAISEAKSILEKKGVSYKNIWFGSDGEAGKFTSKLYSYPTTYVVDSNGNIVGQPILGAITYGEQAKKLDALIDEAIANSGR